MLSLVDKITDDIKLKMPILEKEIGSLISGLDKDMQKDINAILSDAKNGKLTSEQAINRFKKWQ